MVTAHTKEFVAGGVFWLTYLLIESGGGPPHSKKLRMRGGVPASARVLDCASPLALWERSSIIGASATGGFGAGRARSRLSVTRPGPGTQAVPAPMEGGLGVRWLFAVRAYPSFPG